MKRLTTLLAIMTLFVFFITIPQTFAQTTKPKPVEHGKKFVDVNGDGYNDNAKDDDGDGIPNGQDPDYVKTGAGKGKGLAFVDENGDGINDNAPDDDGDGIPNGQDPDYVKPQDGTGAVAGKGFGKGRRFAGFVDEDGDGINDRMLDDDGDGIPNGKDADWVRPQDCLGRGAKMGKGFGKSGGSTSGNGNNPGNGNGGNGGNGGSGNGTNK